MRRLVTRVVILGIFAFAGWVMTSIEEAGPCGSNAVDGWFDESTSIMATFDYTLSSAKSAYERQLNVEYPECMKKLQEYSLDIYYYTWKAEEAYQSGDYSLSTSYYEKVDQAFANMETEADQLAKEHGWE